MPDQPPTDPQPDLAAVIRSIGDGVTRLLASGLNKRAVVVLLRDSTGVGKRDIEKVIDGLETLAKDFTVKPKGKTSGS